MIDPLADKVLMTVMTVTLAMQSLLPGKIIICVRYEALFTFRSYSPTGSSDFG